MPPDDRSHLRADCARCFALCCVVPAFAASADFAITKPARTPCPNLQADSRCGIHSRLRERGFAGCTVYDCFGAGQKVSQVVFEGRDWRSSPGLARTMFAVFPVVRDLHELAWYLTEALTLPAASPLHGELRRALAQTEQLTLVGPDALASFDAAPHRREVNTLLLRASELVRAGAARTPKDYRGADLVGRRFGRAELRGASLRGALLVGADLRGADLTLADVTGADLRGADLTGADLTRTLFLLQSQLDAATGDATTRLPSSLVRPAHWAPSDRTARDRRTPGTRG